MSYVIRAAEKHVIEGCHNYVIVAEAPGSSTLALTTKLESATVFVDEGAVFVCAQELMSAFPDTNFYYNKKIEDIDSLTLIAELKTI